MPGLGFQIGTHKYWCRETKYIIDSTAAPHSQDNVEGAHVVFKYYLLLPRVKKNAAVGPTMPLQAMHRRPSRCTPPIPSNSPPCVPGVDDQPSTIFPDVKRESDHRDGNSKTNCTFGASLAGDPHGRLGNENPNYSMSLDELLEITHSAAITTARAVRWYLLLFHERIGDSLIPSVLDTCSDCLSIARSAGVDDKTNWYFGARFPIYSMRQKKEQKKDRRQQEQLVIKNGRPNSVDKEEIVNSNGVHHQATRLLSDTSDD